MDDSRLEWMQGEFLEYSDSWKSSIAPKKTGRQNPKVAGEIWKSTPYLTRDTDAAVRLTTESTVMCIK